LILILLGAVWIILPNLETREQAVAYDDLKTQVEEDLENKILAQSFDLPEPDVTGSGSASQVESAYVEVPLESNIEVENQTKTYTKEERNDYIKDLFVVDGMLKISKIDLDMLVIEDASLEHLDFSAASLIDSKKPWQGGNYVIAGHRGLRKGQHFNRLNEIEVGDEILFYDMEGREYIYDVYLTIIVHETDTRVVKTREFSEITLITCDPIGEEDTEDRLIVKGRLREEE